MTLILFLGFTLQSGSTRLLFFFFFNDTATTEIYTLSLHDALPISRRTASPRLELPSRKWMPAAWRSEEHTSELQSPVHLVCRLLLEKKNNPRTHLLGTQNNHQKATKRSQPIHT